MSIKKKIADIINNHLVGERDFRLYLLGKSSSISFPGTEIMDIGIESKEFLSLNQLHQIETELQMNLGISKVYLIDINRLDGIIKPIALRAASDIF